MHTATRLILTALSLHFHLLADSQTPALDNLVIKGSFEMADDSALIVFSTYEPGYKPLTTFVKHGKFTIVADVQEPTLAYIRLQTKKQESKPGDSTQRLRYTKNSSPDLLTIYVEPGVMTIDAGNSLRTAKVAGSSSHTDWQYLATLTDPIVQRLSEWGQKYWRAGGKRDITGLAYYNRSSDSGMQAIRDIQIRFVSENPNSYVSLYCLNQLSGLMPEYSFINPLFDSLSSQLKNSATGRKLAERLAVARRMEPGFDFSDFTQADVTGKGFQLSSLKGKYILVDFWASWCKPCREESPNLVTAYKQYHTKGLEIVSVSLDTSRQSWVSAIEKDKLTWHHVSDLKGWYNEVSKFYGITGIPQNILINPEGLIVARNLRGKELNEKLEKLCKQPSLVKHR